MESMCRHLQTISMSAIDERFAISKHYDNDLNMLTAATVYPQRLVG